jgi:hypothetical protein
MTKRYKLTVVYDVDESHDENDADFKMTLTEFATECGECALLQGAKIVWYQREVVNDAGTK